MIPTSNRKKMKNIKVKKKGIKCSVAEGLEPVSTFQTCCTYPTLHNANLKSPNWIKLAEVLKLNTKKTHITENPKGPVDKKRAMAECKSDEDHGHKKSKEVWFDVDESLLETTQPSASGSSTLKHGSFSGLTKAVAMDCEMVGIGDGGIDSMLARVSLVNTNGHCIYDKYVKPQEEVTNYRTEVSGIRPSDIENGEDFKVVQKEVSDLLKGKILVGHALKNDLQVLFLSHPRAQTRDTSKYKPFRKLVNGKTPSLKKLAEKLLSLKIQEGEHSSVQDAQVAMRLYTMHRKQWENKKKK